MRPALLLAALLLAGACLLPATVHAAPPAGSAVSAVTSRCAASVEEAARGILGATSTQANEGYRVQDLVVDPILRKAWVRVADCHDPRKPLTLVPLVASLAASTTATPMVAPIAPQPASAAPAAFAAWSTPVAQPPATPMLIARGDAVQVLVQSSNVRMTLEGHACTAAAAGAEVDVVLDSQYNETSAFNEPPRHLHGIAAGPHRVEVQR